jgi:hypothetical protein
MGVDPCRPISGCHRVYWRSMVSLVKIILLSTDVRPCMSVHALCDPRTCEPCDPRRCAPCDMRTCACMRIHASVDCVHGSLHSCSRIPWLLLGYHAWYCWGREMFLRARLAERQGCLHCVKRGLVLFLARVLARSEVLMRLFALLPFLPLV